jgi:hypothetical protein
MTAGIYISSHLHNDQQADTWYSGIHFIEIDFQGKTLRLFSISRELPNQYIERIK